MTSLHLSERDLQAAAESVSLLPAAASHLRGCSLCQGRVATYRQLFGATALLPPPAFAFDLTASVLAQLPQPRPKLAFPWVLSGVAALVLLVLVLFVVLFGGALLQAGQAISSGLGAGLAVVAGFLVAWQCLELLAQHRRQMSRLTFS